MESFLHIPVSRQNLAACLHLPTANEDRKFPIVLFCHGLTGTRVGTSYRMVRLARELMMHGIASLRFDFRGCGESDGNFEQVTAESLLEDLLAVHEFVAELSRIDAQRVAFVASSFGAYTAARAATRITGLRCLVLLAPVADPHGLIHRDMNDQAWAFLRSKGCIEHHGLPLSLRFFETLPRENVPASLARLQRPLRIFHGTGDQQVPIQQGRLYEQAAHDACGIVDFVEVNTADHGMRGVVHADTIIAGAVDWLRRYL